MILAIIPARRGSKRLPGKNYMLINGISLVDRAQRVAKESGIFDHIHIATDENRHPYICDDQVQTAAVVFDTLCKLNYAYDEFCVLNPTTPTRTAEMLREGYLTFRGTACLASIGGNYRHDGAFLFWRTLDFLRYLSRSVIPGYTPVKETFCVDINDSSDFSRAEKILIEREGYTGFFSAGKEPGTFKKW